MAEVHGMCEKRFGAVRDALAESLDGEDVGACAAVYVDGEPVVDIWGGYADADRAIAWEADTITNVWSTSKTMVALCALILADRGDLDLAAPVARYWPEFAAAGKDGVLVRHLLSHTAGLPGWDGPMTMEDLYDWPAATGRLAAQAPRWEPGTVAGYHSMTQGFLIGEVIRRITGRSLAAFFADEVAGPLGADFHMALPAEHDHRFAPGIAPPSAADGDWVAAPPSRGQGEGSPADGSAAGGSPGAGSPGGGTPGGSPGSGIRLSDCNSPAFRRAEIPPGSGYGNARSVAAVQSVVACGGTARGVRLLSKAGCELAREVQYHGTDKILGMSMRWGMGYGVFGRSCGWGGWGGSLVMVDLDARMAVSYAMNQMLDPDGMGDYRAIGIVAAAYEGLT